MTNYPISLDDSTTIPVESTNTKLSTNHVTAHQNIQDAIEAIEAKVGVDGSAVTTSHDYKLSEVTSTDKAVGKTATQSISNKTFTSSTYNGVTLTTGGSATDVLNAQGNYINGATTDASTTVRGVVELATYAETIARTTTGGTGAKLAVTPDVLPSILSYDYQADSVGTDAYAITCTPAPTAYTSGMEFTFKAGTANTGVCTLNVNGLGAKTIKLQGRDLYTGEILINQTVKVSYDGTNMNMLSQPATYALSSSTYEAIASSSIRTSNTTSRSYPSSQSTYTKMKEVVYNDTPGTITVTYSLNFSGGGSYTNYSRIYINGVAVGTEHTDSGSGTYTENFTVTTGDLVQIYTKVVYTSGTVSFSVFDMYLKYDKQLKQTFVTNTSNS